MRRPGYLADWEQDLRTYLQSRYPGWQPGKLTPREFYTESRLPQSSEDCPLGYMWHAQHGCLPEEAIINTKLFN